MGPLVAAMRKVKEREQKKVVELEGVGEDGTGTVGLGTAAGPLARRYVSGRPSGARCFPGARHAGAAGCKCDVGGMLYW